MRCAAATLAIAGVLLVAPAGATWKPEYGSSPPSVHAWYRHAQVTEAARGRFGFQNCCDKSDRFETKFRVDRATAGDAWYYLVDGQWVRIADDVIHSDEIHAIDPKDDALPEFEQMRREGVLFIYNGNPTCFWPPQGGI